MPKKNYHLVVIGGGPGGLVAAAGAAGLGAKVALIEKNKMGGDCLNTGCIPSKAIIRSAKLAYDLKIADRFGFMPVNLDISLHRVMSSTREVQARIAPHDSVARFQELGVDVYQGQFRFLTRDEITDGESVIRARKFVLAMGASPDVPAIDGLESGMYFTSDTIWSLDELPKKLIVLGGGPVGCELAQVFRRLGAEVTLIEQASYLLNREDVEASDVLETQFRREGIELLKQSQIVSIRLVNERLKLQIKHAKKAVTEVSGDKLLIALGRTPNVSGMNLANACVEYTSRGVIVDDHLQTTNEHIYACGDLCSPFQFTHVADYQARLVLRNALFPGRARVNYRVVPRCTFTEPEIARVGLNEREARENNFEYDLIHYSFKELDRAICDREDNGFVKVLLRKNTDQLLGATITGFHAGDILHPFVLAMSQNIGLAKIAKMIHIYPTLAELSKRVADKYQNARLTPFRKKLLKTFFRLRFG